MVNHNSINFKICYFLYEQDLGNCHTTTRPWLVRDTKPYYFVRNQALCHSTLREKCTVCLSPDEVIKAVKTPLVVVKANVDGTTGSQQP